MVAKNKVLGYPGTHFIHMRNKINLLGFTISAGVVCRFVSRGGLFQFYLAIKVTSGAKNNFMTFLYFVTLAN